MGLSKEEIDRRVGILVELGGINSFVEAFYIQSIIYCAQCAENAFSGYDDCLTRDASPIATVSEIQEALSHAAALSRFFWPARSKKKLHATRAERLKSAFLVSENSPLKDRRLRDTLEHFDERLDKYLLENIAGNFFTTPIVGDSTIANQPTVNIFKLVDPQRNVFVILGEEFEFSDVRDEVNRILHRAIEFYNNGSQLPKQG